MMTNFLRKKEDNKVNLPLQPQQQQEVKFFPISTTPKSDGSVALYFASPHDVPKQLRDALTGFDAASTYLTEDEIKVLELYAGVLEDLELAMMYRPIEIDAFGLEIIRTQMQKSLYAKVRLNKSRYGQILNLTVKTIQEFKHLNTNGDENKSKWRRLW